MLRHSGPALTKAQEARQVGREGLPRSKYSSGSGHPLLLAQKILTFNGVGLSLVIISTATSVSFPLHRRSYLMYNIKHSWAKRP
jgi:hypothetical protein